MSVADLAASRARREPAPADPATGEPAATEEADPSSEPDQTTEEALQVPESDQPETETETEEGESSAESEEAAETETEGESEEAAAPKTGVEAELERMIAEAGLAPDKAAVAKAMGARISKITDQRDTERMGRLAAESKVAELEAKLKDTGTRPQPAPLTDLHPRLAEIDQEMTRLANDEARLKQVEVGQTFTDANGNEVEVTQEMIDDAKGKYATLRAKFVAKREIIEAEVNKETAQRRERANSAAVTHYPWVQKQEAPEYQLAIAELNQLPPALRKAIAALPEFNVLVGRYIVGTMAEQAKSAKAVLPNAGKIPARKVPPKVVSRPAARAPEAASALDRQLREAEAEYDRTGSVKALGRVRSLQRKVQR